MKRAVSLLITFLLTASLCAVAYASGFHDLSQEHWAYKNVMTLVEEGTVNGYEDGSFRPSKTVTRAEFVKMIGKWDRAYEGTLSDITSAHWAYDYIVWSGLEPVDGKIYPDKEMLRSDVINLIWKRNGSPKNDDAPYAISKQGTNKDATSWAYTIGLVQGDDGYNLSLDRALTRAEAATLILRARTVVAQNKRFNFEDVVNNDLRMQVYNATKLFDGAYSAEKTVTYGELARAAMLLSASGKNIVYDSSSIDTKDLIDHEYTKDLYILAHKVWGAEYYSTAVVDKKANLQDVVSALVYGLYKRGGRGLNLSGQNAYFSDCTGANSTVLENMFLTFANKNGIKLKAGTALGAQKTATMKDIAGILLLLDDAIGLEQSYNSNGEKYNAKMNKNLATYPGNYADYRAILDGVPTEVYNLKAASSKPTEFYKTANLCAFIYTGFLKSMETKLNSTHGVKPSFTYYPSMAYEEGKGTTFVVKGILPANTKDISADTLFQGFLTGNTNLVLKNGKEFYIVFATYEPLNALVLATSDVYVKTIIIPN